MSGTNASIPLAFNPQQNLGVNVNNVLATSQGIMQLQQAQQAQQANQAIKNVFADPTAVDPSTGLPKPDIMRQIASIDPQTGMALGQNTIAMQGEQEKLKQAKLSRVMALQGLADPTVTSSLAAYDDAIKNGLPPAAAAAAAQQVYTKGMDELKKGGALSPEEIQMIPQNFDYSRMSMNNKAYQSYKKTQVQDALKERQLDIAQQGVDVRREAADATRGVLTSGKATERDNMLIAQQKIEDENADRAKRGAAPMTPAEEAAVRSETRQMTATQAAAAVSEARAAAVRKAQLFAPATLDFFAQQYLQTGTLPNVGRGGGAGLQQVEDRAAELAQNQGLKLEDVISGRAQYKADQGALNAQQKLLSAATAQSRAAADSFDRALQTFPDGISNTDIQYLNDVKLKGSAAIGQSGAPEYLANLMTALSEYSKVMSGATGAAASTDHVLQETAGLIKPGMTRQQVQGVVGQLKREMQDRLNEYSGTAKETRGRLGNELKEPENPTIRGVGTSAGSPPQLPQGFTNPRIENGRWVATGPDGNTYSAPSQPGAQPAAPAGVSKAPAQATQPPTPRELTGPQPLQVPPQLMNKPDRTIFLGKDGVRYEKRGNQMVPLAGSQSRAPLA